MLFHCRTRQTDFSNSFLYPESSNRQPYQNKRNTKKISVTHRRVKATQTHLHHLFFVIDFNHLPFLGTRPRPQFSGVGVGVGGGGGGSTNLSPPIPAALHFAIVVGLNQRYYTLSIIHDFFFATRVVMLSTTEMGLLSRITPRSHSRDTKPAAASLPTLSGPSCTASTNGTVTPTTGYEKFAVQYRHIVHITPYISPMYSLDLQASVSLRNQYYPSYNMTKTRGGCARGGHASLRLARGSQGAVVQGAPQRSMRDRRPQGLRRRTPRAIRHERKSKE